jgi:hypothetical protein
MPVATAAEKCRRLMSVMAENVRLSRTGRRELLE